MIGRVDGADVRLPVGSYYGEPTGVVGLRLFPNPAFDRRAFAKWDAERYYTDASDYESKDLIKPYRVGMSCGFCHVGPNPVRPPADPERPLWANLSSTVGAQYLRVDRVFGWKPDPANFVSQLFHTSRPGASDTSFIASDSINNPRTMNAIYNLGARLAAARPRHQERLAGGSLDNRQLNEYVGAGDPLARLFEAPNTVWAPRVLKDGADSVGALGALNRVFVNIGLFSEEWTLHFKPLVGGQQTSPIAIAGARKNSAYWVATEAQTPAVALFFLKSAAPHRLADAPGGAAYLTEDSETLTRGKIAFADRCARCHSSKGPQLPAAGDPAGDRCTGAGYLDCWQRYWDHTRTGEFKTAMRAIVLANDFLADNYLSTDLRIPVTLLQTNACSPLASNAIRNHIWDNFSSETYKQLPAVGTITVRHPVTGEAASYQMPGDGRGYTRPPSLVSLWSTAPFLLNNTVGVLSPGARPDADPASLDSNPPPSVQARMASFQDSIEKLLWPALREQDPVFLRRGGEPAFMSHRGSAGAIDRTTARSWLRVATGYVPDSLRPLVGLSRFWLPSLFPGGGEVIEIGPIPAGTPVNLLANLDLLGDSTRPGSQLDRKRRVLDLPLQAQRQLRSLPATATDDEAKQVFGGLVNPLIELSTCPDYVVNRGHYFGTGYVGDEPGLSDADKRALIAFLKTF